MTGQPHLWPSPWPPPPTRSNRARLRGPANDPGHPVEETTPEESTEPYRFRLGNRPPLTGVRALALSIVLTYHSNFETLPGTWVALQVFFVLSGFLITAMLAGEGIRTGRVKLGSFYARRGVYAWCRRFC